ncbi:hypothetical protein LCGC14_0467020 [marine sediment metagenome]|uniref:Phosphoadenosine phosphosulphate reductase domain-containing protein n=1 Tax=marine sediment metagenome TaxID=412755 RepID=A0A0F9SWF1_9ZZZZ
MSTEYHVLSLGAGVQSTTLYLMFAQGLLKPPLDCAIFADTGEEPVAVYQHLEWLQAVGGAPIWIRQKSRLGDDLMRGENSTKQRFASIPAYTAIVEGGREGMLRRQCSKEYKIDVIERAIRYELIGLRPRQRIPKDVVIVQYIGISIEEAGRALRMRNNPNRNKKWMDLRFPLMDKAMTRADCFTWLKEIGNVPHQVPRSACVFCPYHNDSEWQAIKKNPVDWARAVAIDNALRIPGRVVNRKVDQKLYVHRSCVPLEKIKFNGRLNPRELQLGLGFTTECEGVCGV